MPSKVENVSKDNSEQGGNGKDARGLDVKQYFSPIMSLLSQEIIS